MQFDTNGTRPEVLRQLLDQALLDSVAMELKDLPRNYACWLSNVAAREDLGGIISGGVERHGNYPAGRRRRDWIPMAFRVPAKPTTAKSSEKRSESIGCGCNYRVLDRSSVSRNHHSTESVKRLREAFHSVVRQFGMLDASRTPCGKPLSISQAHALMELLQRPMATQGELAELLGLSKSATSRMLASLEQREWLERAPDPDDGRALRLQLTPRGHKVAADVDCASLVRFERLLTALPRATRSGVIQALTVLGQGIASEREGRGADDASDD